MSNKRQQMLMDAIHGADAKANVYSHKEKRRRDGFRLTVFCILKGGNHDEVRTAVAEAVWEWYQGKGYIVEDVTTEYELVASFWYPKGVPAHAKMADELVVDVKMPTYEDLLQLVRAHCRA